MNYKYKFDYLENYGYQDTTPHECMFDQPLYANEWLTHFKERNHNILSEVRYWLFRLKSVHPLWMI